MQSSTFPKHTHTERHRGVSHLSAPMADPQTDLRLTVMMSDVEVTRDYQDQPSESVGALSVCTLPSDQP